MASLYEDQLARSDRSRGAGCRGRGGPQPGFCDDSVLVPAQCRFHVVA